MLFTVNTTVIAFNISVEWILLILCKSVVLYKTVTRIYSSYSENTTSLLPHFSIWIVDVNSVIPCHQMSMVFFISFLFCFTHCHPSPGSAEVCVSCGWPFRWLKTALMQYSMNQLTIEASKNQKMFWHHFFYLIMKLYGDVHWSATSTHPPVILL
jgi:hypothetical protein